MKLYELRNIDDICIVVYVVWICILNISLVYIGIF